MNNGVSCYCRVDWFTPDGSETWGDGRTFILGTEGYLEVRKYIDFQRGSGSKIYLCNQQGQEIIDCEGKVGAPFFPVFVRDLIDRTENAMTQEHAFKAAELSMLAQKMADEQRKDAS
jgi:acetylornithine/succinyldiaminopimelate/putrescine aminotransferase